jgi:hypothetical protein
MNESIDASDMAQFPLFFRGTDSEFHAPEEVAGLLAMKGTTTREELKSVRVEQ